MAGLSIEAQSARQSMRNAESGRDGVEVRIEDTGPGIPAELREQIFNPFVTTKKTGVGLGLSIVSKIMDGHHGSIRVESSGRRIRRGDASAASMLRDVFPRVTRRIRPSIEAVNASSW